MRASLLVLTLALLVGCDAFSGPTATAYGVVADIDTKQPVSNVRVQVGIYVSCGILSGGCNSGLRSAGLDRTLADGTWRVSYDPVEGVNGRPPDLIQATCVTGAVVTCSYRNAVARLDQFANGDTLFVRPKESP